MSKAIAFTKATSVAGAVALAGMLGGAHTAQAEAPPGGENVDAHLGFNISNDYYHRGVAQENEGVIFQPEFEVGWNVWEGDVMGEEVALRPYLGAWASIHDGGSPSGGPSAVYEARYILGGEVDLPYNFDLDLGYTFFNFPGGVVNDTQEFHATVGYDAIDVLEMTGLDMGGQLGLDLYKTVAVETTNGRHGPDTGVYGEFGIHANYDIHALGEDMPITASLGSTLGWSYNDYYQPMPSVNNRDWGFVSLDLGAEMPLHAVIPDEFGAWSVESGLSLVWLGNAPSALGGQLGITGPGAGATSRERFKVLWNTSIGVDF